MDLHFKNLTLNVCSCLSHTGRLCNQPMGLQSGRLNNRLVTASSQWDKYHGSFLARLNWGRRGRYMGAWSAKHNNRYQWLQLDFGKAAKIIRLATQGRQDADHWVTQYYVKHSLDGIRFVEYKERNNRKVREEGEKSEPESTLDCSKPFLTKKSGK